MRKLRRRRIKPATRDALDSLQKVVDASPVKAEKAADLWKTRRSGQKRKAAFADVRANLEKMASGRNRCMYCEDNLGTDIDHFRPKATYPERAFSWPNHLLACSHCNSNEKRGEFPLDEQGKPLLVDPTADAPANHLVFVPETGRFGAITTQGKETARVFGLNRNGMLRKGRRDVWQLLLKIVRDVGAAVDRGDEAAIKREIRLARRLSFQSVVHHFVLEALRPSSSLLPVSMSTIIRDTRSHWTWAL